MRALAWSWAILVAGMAVTAVAQTEPATQPVTAMQHPGIFTSQAELQIIQQRVADAKPGEAMFEGFKSTMKTIYANEDFVPHPHDIVKRTGKKLGTWDLPVDERDSAMVAYTLALRWAITGDAKARDKSLSVMKTWADTLKDHEGDENRFLDSSWVITVWCAAGELMKHAQFHGQSAGWAAEDQAAFAQMIRILEAQSSQIIVRPFNPGSNWGTSSMLGDMAAGVFLDEPEMYARGRDAMLKYMPSILKKDGYANEVFRDPWHGTVAFTGILQAAEVGRHQGDLSIYHAKYDDQTDPRIVVAMRWYADPFRGTPVKLPPMGGAKWKPRPWAFVCDKNTMRSTGGFEMALNFYSYIEPTPDLDQFRDAVLNFYRPSGQDNSLFIESDTLTHGELSNPKD